MKPCKYAYKQVRDNSNEIFKGFGFKHLSDATQYYVHPANQSYDCTTTLCQPIGESVMLLAELIKNMINSKEGACDILYGYGGKDVYLEFTVPVQWQLAGVTQVYRYKAYKDSTSAIQVAAYDRNGEFVQSNPNLYYECYKLLPVLMVMICHYIITNDDYANVFMEFAQSPYAELFVNVHEDFYQQYKKDEYLVTYFDIKDIPFQCTQSFKEKYANINANKNAAKVVIPLEEKHFDREDFREEFRELIPTLSREFVLPESLKTIANAVVEGDVNALLLHGPAGTGKTMSCKLICRETGIPVMDTINCTESLDEFVLGKFLPEGDKIVFWESYVTKAIRYGGAVIFEEINFARPQHLAFLNSLLDDNGFVRLDNGEVVKRHRNFRFFATMNIGYYGTKELNQALYNRFGAVVELDELSDEAITRMLTARVPECSEMTDRLISVYHQIKQKIEAEELDMVISPRNIENWARLARYEGYVAAAEKTIIPAARCDRAAETAFRNIIMTYKWQ